MKGSSFFSGIGSHSLPYPAYLGHYQHAWEFVLLHEARTALRAGDLTVEGSQRYAAWDSDLYQREAWATRREAWYQEQELPRDAQTFLSPLLEQLHRQTLHVSKRIANRKNPDARIEEDKLVLILWRKSSFPRKFSRREQIWSVCFPQPDCQKC